MSGPNLAATVINLLRINRELQDQIAGLSEALHAAVDELRSRDAALDSARRTNQHLRDQIRQSMGTDAAARQRDDDAFEAAA